MLGISKLVHRLLGHALQSLREGCWKFALILRDLLLHEPEDAQLGVLVVCAHVEHPANEAVQGWPILCDAVTIVVGCPEEPEYALLDSFHLVPSM